jgi:hypothetical protein
VKRRRSILRGFGVGAGGEVDVGVLEAGGVLATAASAFRMVLAGGGGGVSGTLSIGIELSAVGVWGVFDVIEELEGVDTGPGGKGSFVAALAEPGKTAGLESFILGFFTSAKAL